jgi:hypothetical protein
MSRLGVWTNTGGGTDDINRLGRAPKKREHETADDQAYSRCGVIKHSRRFRLINRADIAVDAGSMCCLYWLPTEFEQRGKQQTLNALTEAGNFGPSNSRRDHTHPKRITFDVFGRGIFTTQAAEETIFK